MKGLEISEVSLSEVVSSDGSFRIDAEYFKKNYLAYVQKIYSKNGIKLGDVCHFMIGPFGSAYDTSNYVKKSGYRYIRGQDVKPFFLLESEPRFMTEQDFIRLQKYALKKDDLLVSVVGTLGNACIVHESELPAIFSCKSTAVRSDDVNAYYLLAYLNSKYGRELLLRKERGAIQKGLNLDDLKSLDLPQFSNSFYSRVEIVVKHAHAKLFESNNLYRAAEQILLAELGFAEWSPTDEAVSVKSYSDFMSAGRFDAEYFQPKYDELFALLDRCKTCALGGLVDIQRSIEPGSDAYSDKGIPFVRIADFTEMGITPPEIHIPPEICDDSPRPRKDTILLSKDGSVGIAYKVDDNLDVVTSSGILHLTVKDAVVLPDYLTLVLNSKIVRLQAERDAGGSIIQHWKQSEIERVRIPLLPLERQRDIATKVQSSFAFRAESKRLLDLAKRMVEMAIEQGEAVAMVTLDLA